MLGVIEEYKEKVKSYINEIDNNSIIEAVNLIYGALTDGKTVFIAGNGGSMATSMHFAEDLMLSSNLKGRVIPLSNPSAITAISNDNGFENCFTYQLKNLMKKGDVFIAISASGKSKNVLDGIKYANSIGGYTIGISGFKGGGVKSRSTVNLYTSTDVKDYEATEDVHLIICHIIARLFKQW